MGFIYYEEKAKFDKEHEIMRVEYKAAGMSDEDINQIFEWDKKLFREERCYRCHNLDLERDWEEKEESAYENPFQSKFPEAFTAEDRYCINDFIEWDQPIDQMAIQKVLNKLTKYQMRIFKLYVLKNMSQAEIAEYLGISPSAVHHQMERIRKKFKLFF